MPQKRPSLRTVEEQSCVVGVYGRTVLSYHALKIIPRARQAIRHQRTLGSVPVRGSPRRERGQHAQEVACC